MHRMPLGERNFMRRSAPRRVERTVTIFGRLVSRIVERYVAMRRLTGTSFLPRRSCPMSFRFGSVAANCHAAPPPCVPFGAVQEHQATGRTFARPDRPEIVIADQVSRGVDERID